MADDKVQKASALLKQARRMDVVWPEALGPLRPAHRISAGVAAAVMACLPPCAVRMVAQVRRGGRCKGGPRKKGAAWAAGDGAKVGPAWAGPRGNPRQPARLRSERSERGGVKGHEPGVWYAALPDAVKKGKKGNSGLRKEETAGQPLWQGTGAGEDPKKGLGGSDHGGTGYMEERHVWDCSVLPETGTVKQHAKGDFEWDRVPQAQERDPKMPLSKKWPTILQWSGSEEEEDGVSGEEVGQDGEDPLANFAIMVPRRVHGTQADRWGGVVWAGPDEGEGIGGDGGTSEGVCEEAFLQPGTSDLCWQEVLDFDDAEPGEQVAAREPWREEKAEPGAACQIASAGVRRRRRKAADASAGWCGDMGFVPACAAAQGEQRPGPSGTQRARVFFSDGCALCGGLDREVEPDQEVWRAEVSERSSVEEGELVEDGDEQEWWECGMNGGSLMMSFSRCRVESSSRCGLLDGGELDFGRKSGWLRSGGKRLTSLMVSVATEAREDTVRLLKGVYVQDAGVATEGEEGKGSSGDRLKMVVTTDGQMNSDSPKDAKTKDSAKGEKEVELAPKGLARWGEREPFPSRSWLACMFLIGCFGNRFKPRPLSRGAAWPAAKHVQYLHREGGGPRRIALPPPD
ncbi:hypothetical protein NDU88_007392 [Pleurodeles waltl]|uniref:Uncharacterized protein n=1 Tax=Pleurodeles waltl TaxID=8319 RepID=A0AAV7PL49_PLEWA|nr:hypothetical protein NDU88_007392 [Pleurodeles waltl]